MNKAVLPGALVLNGPDYLSRLQAVEHALNKDAFAQAVVTVLKRYNIQSETLAWPTVVLSGEAILYPPTGRLRSGSAGSDKVILYAPGLAERERCGANFALVTLNARAHEHTHVFAGSSPIRTKMMRVGDVNVISYTHRGGFQTLVQVIFPSTFDPQDAASKSNTWFNEGVTELFGQEICEEYLALDPTFAGVTVDDIARRRLQLEGGGDTTFYDSAVKIIRSFISVLAMGPETEAKLWEELYADYFRSIDLLTSPAWAERFEKSSIKATMRKIAGAEYKDLPRLEYELLFPDRPIKAGLKLDVSV